jgi:putative thioredoxin
MASLIDPSGRPIKVKDKDAGKGAPAPGSTSGNSALIKDSSLTTFAADVLDASMEAPVIVDFWAPWCGPCKQLTPLLEKAVTDAKGKVRMVKVNIDENPEIAQQLRIQSIPTVYAFRNGQPVDGFMGAIPESQIKQFVQGLIAGGGGGPAEPEGPDIDGALTLAAQALAVKDWPAAAQIFGEILQAEPGHPKAVAGLARCYLESGDLERAKKTLGLVRPDGQTDEAIRAVEAELALREKAANAGDVGPLKARIAADPGDLEARFQLATVLDAKGERDDAINELLEIVKRDRKWNEEAAKKQLLTLFEAMGPMDARTIHARRRLSSLLFS